MIEKKFIKKVSSFQRVQRSFSDEFKRKKVSEIDKNIASVSEICREYEVSRTSIYRWIYKFSLMRKKSIKTIVEAKSDTRKIQHLRQQIDELERLLGQKQLLLEFHQKLIDLAEEHYQVDIKKKFGSTPFSGSGNIKKASRNR